MDNELNNLDDNFCTDDIGVPLRHEELLDRIIFDLPVPVRLALAVGIGEN